MGRKKILADFKKKTHKVGKKINPTNQTKIKVKTKKIWVPNQGIKAENGVCNEKEELLSFVKHLKGQNDHGRVNALQNIATVFLGPEVSSSALETVPLIFPAIMELLFDDEKEVRDQVVLTVTSLLAVLPSSVIDAVAQLYASTIRSALNHFNKTIRKDAMILCCEALSTHPTSMSHYSQKLFESIVPILQDKSLVYTFAANISSEDARTISFSNANHEKMPEIDSSVAFTKLGTETISAKVKTEESDRQHGQQAKSTLFQFALKALYLLLNLQQQSKVAQWMAPSHTICTESSPNGLLFLDFSFSCVSLHRLASLMNSKVLSASSSLLFSGSYNPLNSGQRNYNLVDSGQSISNIGKALNQRLLSVWNDLTHSYDPQANTTSTNVGTQNSSLPHDTLALLADCLTLLFDILSSSSIVDCAKQDSFTHDSHNGINCDIMLQTLCRNFPYNIATLDMAIAGFVATVSRNIGEQYPASAPLLMYRERVILHLVQLHCGGPTQMTFSNPTKKRTSNAASENKRKMKKSSLSLLVADEDNDEEENDVDSENLIVERKVSVPDNGEKKVKKKACGQNVWKESVHRLNCLLRLLQLDKDSDVLDDQLKELRMSTLSALLKYIDQKTIPNVLVNKNSGNNGVDVEERCLSLQLLLYAVSSGLMDVNMSVGNILRILLQPLMTFGDNNGLGICYVSGRFGETSILVIRQILLLSSCEGVFCSQDIEGLLKDILVHLFCLLESTSSEEGNLVDMDRLCGKIRSKRQTAVASKEIVLLFLQRLYNEVLSLLPVASLLKIHDTQITSEFSLLTLILSQKHGSICDELLSSLVSSMRNSYVNDTAVVLLVGRTVANAFLSVIAVNSDSGFIETMVLKLIKLFLSLSSMMSSGESDSLSEMLKHFMLRVQQSPESMSLLQVIVSRQVLSTVEHFLYSNILFNNCKYESGTQLLGEDQDMILSNFLSVIEICKEMLIRSLSTLLSRASIDDKGVVNNANTNVNCDTMLKEVAKTLVGSYISLSNSFPYIFRNMLSTFFTGQTTQVKLIVLRELTVAIAEQIQQLYSRGSVYCCNSVNLIKDVTELFLQENETILALHDVKEFVFDLKNALEHVAALYAN